MQCSNVMQCCRNHATWAEPFVLVGVVLVKSIITRFIVLFTAYFILKHFTFFTVITLLQLLRHYSYYVITVITSLQLLLRFEILNVITFNFYPLFSHIKKQY